MILKAIQEKFKIKSGQKFLEEELKKNRSFSDKKGIAGIAVIVDMDNFKDAEVFQDLRKTLNVKPNAVRIMGYKKAEDKHGMFSTPFVTEKQLGWNGTIENGDFAEFTGRDYDVLINYYNQDRLFLKIMSAKVNARIRVGIQGADEAMNDLIIDCPLGDIDTFANELKKYLKILKELE